MFSVPQVLGKVWLALVPQELSAVHFFEKHCSDIDVMTSRA